LEGRKIRSGEIADSLTWLLSETVQLTTEVIAQQMIAETEIVITRPGQRRVRRGQGRVRKHEPGAPLRLRLIVVRLLLPDDGLAREWLLLTNLGEEVSAELIAEWYYWRWVIESYFKLCKSAGQRLEEWRQESAAAMACVVVWQVQRDDSTAGGRTASVAVAFEWPASASWASHRSSPAVGDVGVVGDARCDDVMQHYDLAELKQMARVTLPCYSFDDTG
jgi:hypothetical protein